MADTCEDCGRPKWDGGHALSVRECGARGSGTCQGFTEARKLRALLDRYRALAKAADAMYTIGLRSTDEWNAYAAARAAVREIEVG